jgi:hypothetical protein
MRRYQRHASRNSRGRDDIQRNPQAVAENMNPCGAHSGCCVGRLDKKLIGRICLVPVGDVVTLKRGNQP